MRIINFPVHLKIKEISLENLNQNRAISSNSQNGEDSLTSPTFDFDENQKEPSLISESGCETTIFRDPYSTRADFRTVFIDPDDMARIWRSSYFQLKIVSFLFCILFIAAVLVFVFSCFIFYSVSG